MANSKTVETQNQVQYEEYVRSGPATMGPWTSYIWRHDPRHIGFLLARYKFCAKMLAGKRHVVEIGCGDAFGTPIVLQTVQTVHGADIEPVVIEDARRRFTSTGEHRATFEVADVTSAPLSRKFDAAYSCDVIEHIPRDIEGKFMRNITASLTTDAVCIMGTPNITAQPYASEASRKGHINLKSGDTLRALMAEYFANVFIFSMNDEVVHTGFYSMAHYIIGMGVGLKAK